MNDIKNLDGPPPVKTYTPGPAAPRRRGSEDAGKLPSLNMPVMRAALDFDTAPEKAKSTASTAPVGIGAMVINLLESTKKRYTAREIADKLGVTRKQATDALKRLKKRERAFLDPTMLWSIFPYNPTANKASNRIAAPTIRKNRIVNVDGKVRVLRGLADYGAVSESNAAALRAIAADLEKINDEN